jgi:hypothetical protein
MKRHAGIAVLMLLAAYLDGQQAAQPSPIPKLEGGVAAQQAQQPSLEIYQIDLIPSGTGFALSKPVLDGDKYVFIVWPDRATIRLSKDRVKSITPRTKEMSAFAVYQIDLVPTGRMISKEAPTLKGTTYTFRTWRDNTLISMRQADVKKVTQLTGLAAFKVQQEERGAKLTANLPMQGTDDVQIINSPPPEPSQASAGASSTSSNGMYWIYDGIPGMTTGYAPPNATVAYPGDVPKAAEPPH